MVKILLHTDMMQTVKNTFSAKVNSLIKITCDTDNKWYAWL